MLELKAEFATLKVVVDEIRTSQQKIAGALLGSFEAGGVGLLEQQRANTAGLNSLKEKVEKEIKAKVEAQEVQITELVQFRREIRKVVAIIAFGIPIVFEILKGIVIVLYDYAMKHHGVIAG